MRTRIVVILLIAALAFSGQAAIAQTLTTGDITGSVTDVTGAVVPGVNIALRSLDTGATQSTTTNDQGVYRFTLLKPGHYSVTGSQTGFKSAQRAIDVGVGQSSTADLALEVGDTATTIEVTEAQPLINTEPANVTGFTTQEVSLLPSPGSDITNIAFTTPGAVVNVTGGYGNFTVNGLPATSNLFTINGENDMDPYFNINNSGASNLTLGQNEIQEATVITNPYAGQYGQLSGAQVTYVTKSGSNVFHGNAQYWWNGRYLNANNWFNNATDTPRAFSNSNQWAASLGGPIWRNHTFFFLDYEDLRFVLPNVDSLTIPTTDFANAVLANVQATQPAEASTYQKMFGLWQNAPGAANAQPIANTDACNALTLPGFNPATQNCSAKFQATPTAQASEWILASRVDHRFSDKDNAYFRYRGDHGLQPTSISPISPNFNAISNQPSYDLQFNETHVFGPRATNLFTAALSHYQALFQQNQQLAYGTFPYDVITSGSVPFTNINEMRAFPQGRNITQYQFIDDFTLNRGKHNWKFGVNFRRYDVSDHNFFYNTPAVYFGYTGDGLQNFADGLAYQYRQADNPVNDVPIAMWGMGIYAQDEWNVTPYLHLTLALRTEHNSNPVCQFNCFANFNAPFSQLSSFTNADPGSVAYSADIATGLHQAYSGTDAINWSPRLGFSWSPMHDNKTVISGGAGIFFDNPAAGMVDSLLGNPPLSVTFRVRPSGGVLPFDPNGGAAIWAQSAAAFDISKTYSQIKSELAPLGVTFAPPAFNSIVGTIHSPQFQEWNFQVQREITSAVVVILNYTGNHGIHIPYSNPWPNAFDQYGYFPGVPGVPTAPPVPNYGTVTSFQSGALSNYHGLNAIARVRFGRSLTAQFNYTWSHAIDEVSNGGLFTYGDSLLGQINPLSLRTNNYGNADYDIRHNINANWVYSPSWRFANHFLNAALGGWQWSGKFFWRTGLPFSVTDGNSALGNGGGTILGQYIGGTAQPNSCGESANYLGTGTCLNAAAFVNAGDPAFTGYTAWPAQTRNQFRGPHYLDVDMALFKTFRLTERFSLGLGMQGFNVFNHPNFGQPDSVLGDSTFGQITGMAAVPTSPYGNFLGFDSSPRVVQLTGKIVF
jgi:hypothetical protein